MTLEELYRDAMQSKKQDSLKGITLYLKHGVKRPIGFPRGELFNETEGGRVYFFDADKIIAWVKKQPQFSQVVK